MTTHNIDRRRALAVVAVVPAAVALSAYAPASVEEDAELLTLGEQCKKPARRSIVTLITRIGVEATPSLGVPSHGLAKLQATTVEGLNVKAMVLAVAHDAFDDPNIWNEPLQKSITRDIKSMAEGRLR
jgi:hypothetical protein